MAGTEYIVRATDAASRVFEQIGLSAENLDRQLHDLSDRVATPEVDLKDAKFTAGIIRAAERIDKLSAMIADPKVEVDTRKAQAEILRITAQLDRLDAKKVNVTVDVDRRGGIFSRLGGLFGGAGGAIGGAGSAIGGGVSSLGQYGQGALYGGLGILGALLGPALLPVGLGVLGGGGAAAGAFALGSAANKQMQALAKSLASAKPGQRGDIRAQMAALRKQSGPELAIFGAFQDLGGSLKDTFAGALKSTGTGFSGAGPNQSFLTSLTGILKQIGGFIKTIGPLLGDMFRASIPYLQMFVKFLERAAVWLLPAFTKMLVEMQPFLPVIFRGLMDIVKGFVGFLNAIGPSGMKASARIFVILAEGMAGALVALGHTINWLTENIPKWTRFIVNEWKTLSHETAVIFDGVRHDIAHIWDMIFQNSIGMVIRLVHNVETQYNSLRHGIAVTFDTVRHDIAAAWDTIWHTTVGQVQRIVGDVVGWFQKLPGRALDALRGFGHSLYAFAHAALDEFLSGLKAVGGSVLSWLRNFIGGIPHAIMSFLHMSPPHAGSVFFDLGANLMHHLEAGIKSTAHRAVNAATAVAHRVSAAGSGVQRWAPLVLQALRMEGLSSGLLGNVLFQMQTESGGNPNAINLTDSNAQMGDPSRGLMQTIMSTFQAYHWPGTSNNIYDPLANIAAALNYARHVYGPTLMSGGMGIGSGHGYDQGGWLPTGLSLAWNNTGRPERVLGPGQGGNTYHITVNVPPSANKADVGRQVVETIREYEKRSGTGWRR